MAGMKEKGVEFAYVTLHVGAGTFQLVKVDNINDHHMAADNASARNSGFDAEAAAKPVEAVLSLLVQHQYVR